nr:MAG TPA: hypothetical protein [Caudoviricetes sp.]
MFRSRSWSFSAFWNYSSITTISIICVNIFICHKKDLLKISLRLAFSDFKSIGQISQSSS